MKTEELEVLVMQHFKFTKNIVVPNVSWGIKRWPEVGVLHECDVLSLTKAGYATEIEIKISKADLLKDKEKVHGHNSNFIKFLYFAVPKKLEEIALQEIPERAGLLVVEEYLQRNNKKHTFLRVVKGAKANPDAVKWKESEREKLLRLGCMRIVSLKKKYLKMIKHKVK